VLIDAYKKLNNYQQKTQYKYMLSAFILSLAIASTNFLSNLGLSVYPLGALSSIFFVGIVMYAIIRHELLDIRIIIKQTLLFSILTFFITAIYAVMLGGSYLFFSDHYRVQAFLPGVATLVAVIFLFQPVRERVQKWLEKLFHREMYDYRSVVTELSGLVNREMDAGRLVSLLAQRLVALLNVRSAGGFIYNAGADAYECTRMETHPAVTPQPPDHPQTITISKEDDLITYFTKYRAMAGAAVGQGRHRVVNAARHPEPPALAVPFFYQDELTGFLVLGPRISDLPFSPTDLELLSTIANQAAVVLHTIYLFYEMEKVRGHLYAQDKMAALGALAFGIAHEIKNPLTPIRTFTQLLARKSFLTEREQDMGQRVLAEFQRVDTMLNSLLIYGRAAEIHLVPVHVPQIIDDTLMLYGDVVRGQGIRIITNCDQTLPAIQADIHQLRQVFMNIIGNAMEAMPRGGTLTVAAKHLTTEQKMVISFADTGCGIPPENHDKVFKTLFTTKPHGTGLGLAICRQIIKEHNGAIWLTSGPGKGTTFYISFGTQPAK
jgi:signal transduction histidine kinase